MAKLEKFLAEYTLAIHDPVNGGEYRRRLMALSKTINTFMQETMVEIDDEILEFQKSVGKDNLDYKKMAKVSDEVHEGLKYLRGMFKELSES